MQGASCSTKDGQVDYGLPPQQVWENISHLEILMKNAIHDHGLSDFFLTNL